MYLVDWIVLITTLLTIVGYGIYKTKQQESLQDYLLGGNEASWWTVGLSVMATQASAITFISTPGQAFHDGMGFVQFYFGLPIAMVVICLVFIPIYKRLQVYTAYGYLEQRFDVNTRILTAMLFLIQRGLAAGITIYAPSIILSTIFGWNLKFTIILIGILVVFYTLSGGTKAVNVTQKLQMGIIFIGLIIAFVSTILHLPETMSFGDAVNYAGNTGKLEILDFSFNLENRYTVWSGLIGGTFLALSYFGTDQSQVQRYLSSSSVRESQKGLIMNGLLKVPLQFFILGIGVMVFVVLSHMKTPLFFNTALTAKAHTTSYSIDLTSIEKQYDILEVNRDKGVLSPGQFNEQKNILRSKYIAILKYAVPNGETNDKDYVFLYYILNYLPKGLIGLLLAMIFCAAMSSTASELNALASTTTIDIWKRKIRPEMTESYYVLSSKVFTLLWGIIAILFACFGTLFENLIQFVNIIGSIFYGTILGVFLTGFFIKYVQSRAIFIAACISEMIIIYLWWIDYVPFLWLNLIGCILTMVIAMILQTVLYMKSRSE